MVNFFSKSKPLHQEFFGGFLTYSRWREDTGTCNQWSSKLFGDLDKTFRTYWANPEAILNNLELNELLAAPTAEAEFTYVNKDQEKVYGRVIDGWTISGENVNFKIEQIKKHAEALKSAPAVVEASAT